MNYYKMLPRLFLILSFIVSASCNNNPQISRANISDVILTDTSSYFYIDTKAYPVNRKNLPVGIFDSGTGGLTVMEAIVGYDQFKNLTGVYEPDGIPDFGEECFIYLADQANMPYGNYAALGKTDLLKEHILKDVQFLIGNKYYRSAEDNKYHNDKLPVKAIVIACNTATAYGMTDIENFFTKAGLYIKVIGVINAGVKGAFENIPGDENLAIGVMATEGTVLSDGYVEAIKKYTKKNGHYGSVEIYQQAGIGLAGAIDGLNDYIDYNATNIRAEYKGPSVSSDQAGIDLRILHRYDFDWNNNKILYTGDKKNPTDIQLNSIENYIYYNLVELIEQIKNSGSRIPLKKIILGCTHYPFYKNIFTEKLSKLYNIKEEGKYVYREFMVKDIEIIDPARNTAKELFEFLKENDMLNEADMSNSEFFISVPNVLNKEVVLDLSGGFTYEYKYGRDAAAFQEYVKRVPFSKSNLKPDVVSMLRERAPLVFKLIRDFNHNNIKTKYLRVDQQISF